MDIKNNKQEYKRDVAKKVLFIFALIVILSIVAIYSCAIGTGYGFFETYDAILKHIMGEAYVRASAEWWRDHYIWENILPSVAISMVAGAGLAVGGTVMQSMMGNPLADPYTTGISSGACLGAVAAIVVGFTFASTTGEMGIITNAFIFSMIPAFIVIGISKFVGNSPSTMILIGTALSSFFNSIVTLLMISTDADTLRTAFVWQIGSVTSVTWSDLPLITAIVLVTSISIGITSSKLNILTLGEDSAKTLGVDVDNFRLICLAILSILVATIVSYTGIIGFVGLVSPHIARFIIGGNNRFVLPAAMLISALMLNIANVASRLLIPYGDIPVGVVMAFIGAPIFLYLVVKSKANREMF